MSERSATRRQVLGCGVVGCATLAGVVGCSRGAASVGSASPSGTAAATATATSTPTSSAAVSDLAALSAVPARDALPVVDAAGNPGFLLRNGSAVVYLSAVCSHGGCNVAWDPGTGRFVCPCHLSEFDRTGRVLNPPAPGPLASQPVTVVDGQVRLA